MIWWQSHFSGPFLHNRILRLHLCDYCVMEFKIIENKEPFFGIFFLNAGNKKTVCLDENHFNQNKLFFIFTLILFYENNWFHEICRWIWNINKRKKYFSNSQIKSYHYTLLYRYYGSIWFYMCSTVQSPQAVLNGVVNLLSHLCYQSKILVISWYRLTTR